VHVRKAQFGALSIKSRRTAGSIAAGKQVTFSKLMLVLLVSSTSSASLSLSPSLTLSTLPHLKIGFSARDTRIDRIVLLQYSLLVLDTLSQFKASLQKDADLRSFLGEASRKACGEAVSLPQKNNKVAKHNWRQGIKTLRDPRREY